MELERGPGAGRFYPKKMTPFKNDVVLISTYRRTALSLRRMASNTLTLRRMTSMTFRRNRTRQVPRPQSQSPVAVPLSEDSVFFRDRVSRLANPQRRAAGDMGSVRPYTRSRTSLVQRSGHRDLFRFMRAICVFQNDMEAPGRMFT